MNKSVDIKVMKKKIYNDDAYYSFVFHMNFTI